MHRHAPCQIENLMAARCARSNDDRFRRFGQAWQQRKPGDLRAQIEMLGLKTERASHAAAAGVQHIQLDPRRLAQSCDRGRLRTQRLLMAMPMIDAWSSGLLQIELAFSLIDLAAQPAFR